MIQRHKVDIKCTNIPNDQGELECWCLKNNPICNYCFEWIEEEIKMPERFLITTVRVAISPDVADLLDRIGSDERDDNGEYYSNREVDLNIFLPAGVTAVEGEDWDIE